MQKRDLQADRRKRLIEIVAIADAALEYLVFEAGTLLSFAYAAFLALALCRKLPAMVLLGRYFRPAMTNPLCL